MKTTRVKPWVKWLGVFVGVIMIVYGMYAFGAFDFLTLSMNNFKITDNKQPENTNNSAVPNMAKNDKNAIEISTDEWIGSKVIIDANGGLTTQKGSIYDQLGLKVNIRIINDANQSSNALIKGDLDGALYTINRLAFLNDKFKSAKVPIVMPYIVNSSAGGDGIIAREGINRVEDLVGKKIGVPRFSEAQTLVEWLLMKSSLTPEQVAQIKKDMVYFDTPDDAAKACFAKQVDAAGTWQPFINNAVSTTGFKVLFSTNTATNIVIDGVVFRKDYIDKNMDKVTKFIEGTLKAESLYDKEFKAIKASMPMFATDDDANIKKMIKDATLTSYAGNKDILNGIAQTLYSDMANIWKGIGEKADPNDAKTLFDSSIIASMEDKFPTAKPTPPTFTEEQKTVAKAQDNSLALLKQTLTINFLPDSAIIKDESFETLNKFVETAKILNGAIIQIEGNVANVGEPDPELEAKLSYERAKSVAKYLQVQGVDPNRFIIIGNGTSKQLNNNETPEQQEMNRRTDIFFKVAGR